MLPERFGRFFVDSIRSPLRDTRRESNMNNDNTPQATTTGNSNSNGLGETSGQARIIPVRLEDSAAASDNKIPESDSLSLQADTETEIARLAKNYEPVIRRIVAVLDSAGIRVLETRGHKAGWTDSELAPILDKAQMSDETRALMTTSGARIAARNIKDPAQMDYIALTGALADWSSGLFAAARALKVSDPITEHRKRHAKDPLASE